MGQKINPYGYRLGAFYPWKSRWFINDKDYQIRLLEDIEIRKFLLEYLKGAGIADVEIERTIERVSVRVSVGRPGVVIGRGGTNLERLQKMLMKKLKMADPGKLKIEIVEVEKPNLSARIVAVSITEQLVKRMPHRRVISRTLDRVMESGAKGIKVMLSGRIGGAEIGRSEKYSRGTVPLQTMRSQVDYAQIPALTKFGYIGVKVWIHK